MTYSEATERIEQAMYGAQATERANREAGSPPRSVAFDAGRVAGLKEAAEILARVRRGSSTKGEIREQ
jgi:hypothetical protein